MSQFDRFARAVLRIDGASAVPDMDERLRQAVDDLAEREREIVVRRFGLDGGKPATLVDLAAELDLTTERVRQLEAHSIAQVRTKLGVSA